MAPPFRKISMDQLAALAAKYPFSRPIDSILLVPSEKEDDTPVTLWMRDTRRGEPDVAWHLAADPAGGVWLGRDWNLPAGRDGAFLILLLGGPDAPRDEGERAAALIRERFRETAETGESGLESVAAGRADDAATDDLLLTLLRNAGPVRLAVPAGEGVPTGEELPFFPETITTEIKEALRPHAINLTEGRFSTGGLFDTSQDDVDAMFGEHLEKAVARHGPGNPLRIVIWAHGGLVNERDGLLNAYKHVLWWQRNGVYPIYFVWETGLLKSVRQLLTRGAGGEEGVTDFLDRRLEEIVRAAQGPKVWGVMKQNARAAVDPDTGGAAYAAAKLADFCRRHPGAVELHAAGHSAGAIFHASFVPAALDLGAPPFRGLYLLAPAVRADLFLERLAPRLGAGKGIKGSVIFTMNKDRELADNCVLIYRKSLLYLIHFALEEQREAPILGLEISLRGDAKLKEMFGLGGAGGTRIGEVIWSKSPATAGPRDRSRSTSHGEFDDDAATMDSVLRRVLDNDAIALSFEKAGTLSPELAVPEVVESAPAPAPQPPPIHTGEEAAPEEDEDEEVPFTVLDAIERATEAAEGIGPQASEPEEESFLEAVETINIGFGPNAKAADVTDFSRQVLTDILKAAGLTKATVSSTSRLPADQARVMYANLEKEGIDAQRKLYKEPGRQVIEVYRQGKLAGKDAATIQAEMRDKIIQLGPTTVSRHASDPKILNVFDVAPSSVAKRTDFEAAVRAEKRVNKFLLPPNDPGYHLEIPQPKA